MLEILFRGKQIDNGEWVEGVYFPENETYPSTIFRGKGNSVGRYVLSKTVGQYTGLTDKNGKKIFEGDIVKGLFLFGMEIYSEVSFRDGSFGLKWYRGDVLEFNAFTSICNVVYEVVGNVYDNPELLEKKTED